MARKKLKPLFQNQSKTTQYLELHFEKINEGLNNHKLIIRRKGHLNKKFFICKLDCKNAKVQDLVTLVCNKLKDMDLKNSNS